MIMDSLHNNELEGRLDAGRLVKPENYIANKDAAPDLQSLIDELDPRLIKARGLDEFLNVERDFLPRVVCLPTTMLVAIRHLTDSRLLTLRDFYELGIYSQINDRQTNSGVEKGFPSFHYKMLDTYLRYALEFAKVAGLYGGIITNFSDLSFSKLVLTKGVIIPSVDNLFIPAAMNRNLDPSSFKPSRHTELVHAIAGNDLVVTDVTNYRNGEFWETKNILVRKTLVEEHLTCPRLNDFFTRAIILTKDQASWEQLAPELTNYGKIVEPNYNPIIKPFFGQGVATALESIRTKANQGLAQWEMID
ncbi:MAG: hypothetical protein IT416_02990 [Candidatus Pacebacteria bacterium]|nr:hypothetical protein [Candidatus Paceibacterota bacterium]